jgi:hypothetical protein|tara:strand:- start:680 stop:811 length:132 start_codon:yes stop_codon:yes gene_type:complete
MSKTKKQQLKELRRKAIRFQNKSSRKLTMAEAMREVQNVSDDV